MHICGTGGGGGGMGVGVGGWGWGWGDGGGGGGWGWGVVLVGGGGDGGGGGVKGSARKCHGYCYVHVFISRIIRSLQRALWLRKLFPHTLNKFLYCSQFFIMFEQIWRISKTSLWQILLTGFISIGLVEMFICIMKFGLMFLLWNITNKNHCNENGCYKKQCGCVTFCLVVGIHCGYSAIKAHSQVYCTFRLFLQLLHRTIVPLWYRWCQRL